MEAGNPAAAEMDAEGVSLTAAVRSAAGVKHSAAEMRTETVKHMAAVRAVRRMVRAEEKAEIKKALSAEKTVLICPDRVKVCVLRQENRDNFTCRRGFVLFCHRQRRPGCMAKPDTNVIVPVPVRVLSAIFWRYGNRDIPVPRTARRRRSDSYVSDGTVRVPPHNPGWQAVPA